MMRILLFGSTGQLGQECLSVLSDKEVTAVGREQVDLTDPAAISRTIVDYYPDLIINTAAYTAVDKAEVESDLAFAVNETAPRAIATAAQQISASFIHVSTDYVFNGHSHLPYQEIDPTQPIGVYGQSKLAGEAAVQQECDRSIILRTAWVYSAYGKGNFVKTMLKLGSERESIKVVMDQIGSPTWAQYVAEAIHQLVPLMTESRFDLEPKGIYHCTNSGVASWYDFAIAIFEEAHQIGFPLRVKRVEPITTAQFPTAAQRPPYSVLSNKKLDLVLGSSAPYWRTSLRQMLSQLYTKTYESTYSLRR